ncbi:AbrB/MazE/SpoVT family DNA-binding domain-containing protein [Thermococcus sp. LS2]|uniref:AbrB/MazE/SpoVT family DNA-binding domain-containing protein n=1 Tax=Thermococcus sp. LS2 TaxID=1638260 RepID=UPI00143878E1|nr:AbrB/MazE/SpoVT family DNA-binding domain-containing protein [Thermococcus sp. LS2]NJE12850.1 AbrB family transcriptional regulator [Thermococcus sp. LS2]
MEVLAKFHVIVHKIGRIIIPAGTRKFYGIEHGDFVEIRILKYESDKKPKEGTFTARVGEQGSIFIPKPLREVMGIKPGDVIEVLLLAHHKAGEVQE